MPDKFDQFAHFPDCTCTQCLEHPSQARPGVHPFPGKLHVLTMLENPLRWRNRYWNYQAFERMVHQAGAILHTVEVAFGGRHFEITDPDNPRHLQLRTESEIWHKENALNLLLARLPQDAQYVAWLDSDIQFSRSDWAQETLQLLQHYQVLQMFSFAQDLGPNDEPTGPARASFVFRRQHPEEAGMGRYEDQGSKQAGYGYGAFGNPGFGWAWRKQALNAVGCLIDYAIIGAGDLLMAAGLYNEVEKILNSDYSESYKRLALLWQDRAQQGLRQNIGCLPGTIMHHWHGTRADRRYDQRWRLLVEQKFDPVQDLRRDWQGLYQLEERRIGVRDGMRDYNRARNEDSNQGTLAP